MKMLLFVLCVAVVILLAVVAKCLASLNDLDCRLNALEKEQNLGLKSLGNEKDEQETRRSKRSVDEKEFNKAMIKLEKLEGRVNRTYQYVGYQRAILLLRGPRGKNGAPGSPGLNGRDGKDGPQGSKGQKGTQGDSAKVGVTYIWWGKRTCPNSGATLVYEGYVGGSHYSHKGGASNYVCLTRDPIYEKSASGGTVTRIYGAEYQTYSYGIYPSSLHDHDVPYTVCHVTTRASQMMIPGRNVCPAGWIREYKGYLMSGHYTHHRTMYTCMDENPDYTRGTHANLNGALFYFVEGVCGSRPCKPYIAGKELTCAVCTR